MVQQYQIASAANMIGKYAQGTDQNSNQTAGTITAVGVTTSGVRPRQWSLRHHAAEQRNLHHQ